MRKVYLSMLLLMLCVTCAVANPITQAQALRKAKAFLQKKGMATTANLDLVYQGRQVTPQHGAPAKDPCYYVFNNGHNAGFIIMAGDDCAEEVLGYADSGTFDPNDIPDNMQEFLKGYVEEITAARARNASGDTDSDETDVELTRKVVAPLIQTHWNQGDPYNQQCFTTSGEQAKTGCVATALAQVMYYHKWPKGSTSEVPAYSSYSALPATTFDWDKMKTVYLNTGEDDEAAEAAVAKLMHYCGQAVKMSYGTGASGASPTYIPGALKNYFGYPNDPKYVSRNSYTTEEWDELIYTELKFGRPVLYGANTFGGSGHQFICDGYDGHGLYHINWGWGGLSDGYFRLQALRPADQGAGGSDDYGGYSMGQDAIIGVSATEIVNTEDPEEPIVINSGLETHELKVTSDLAIDYAPTNGFNSVQVTYTFALAREETCIDHGMAVCQDGQILQQNVLKEKVTLDKGYAFETSGNLFRNIGQNLTDGTYQIVGISRVNGTEEWYINERSDKRYVEVVISNGHATFTNVEINPPVRVYSLDVTKVEQRFDLGEDFTQIRAYIANTGTVDYSSSVSLRIDNQTKAKEGIYIPVGGEDYIDFFFEPMSSGTVKLELWTLYTPNSYIYTNEEFLLSEYIAPTLPTINVVDYNIKNLGSNKMYGSMFDATVTLHNDNAEDFEGNIELTIGVFKEIAQSGGWRYTPRTTLYPINIKAGETKTIPINYTGMAVGDKILYYLYDPAQNLLTSTSWFIDVVPAIVTWKATGERTAVEPTSNFSVADDVCAVSLEDLGKNLGSYNIIKNDNPNTIYYVTGDAIGFDNSLLTIVRGGIAGDVYLDANYDFYIPKYFRADHITYGWTPVLGADGKNGWQTITLPFGVQSVNSAGTSIDWYRSTKNEGEKDFWVREFKQVVGNVVQFADAREWVANVPYIIAVPGDHWGSQYDLTNKEMQFKADNVLVERTAVSAVVSDGFEFAGLTGGLNPLTGEEQYALGNKLGDTYILNASGNAFVPANIPEIMNVGKHGLCYFAINDHTITPPACLNIGTFDNTDGISTPKLHLTDEQLVNVYAIDGVKVSTATINNGIVNLDNLPKGVYIVEGKKVVKK